MTTSTRFKHIMTLLRATEKGRYIYCFTSLDFLLYKGKTLVLLISYINFIRLYHSPNHARFNENGSLYGTKNIVIRRENYTGQHKNDTLLILINIYS
jgi:hypothetical protein